MEQLLLLTLFTFFSLINIIHSSGILNLAKGAIDMQTPL